MVLDPSPPHLSSFPKRWVSKWSLECIHFERNLLYISRGTSHAFRDETHLFGRVECMSRLICSGTGCTARSLEDEIKKSFFRNIRWNANRNPEWWKDCSPLQIQIQPKSGFEFVPRDTEESKFDRNLNPNLYREIPTNLSFTILTSWLKFQHHSGFRFAFRPAFRVYGHSSSCLCLKMSLSAKEPYNWWLIV